jgi:NADP oxidoreductase coenzyme F420-dependent
MTDVGIIGAGRLRQAVARTALGAGRSVVIANSHGPESLAAIASDLGASAGTVGEAAAAGIVVIAVPWDRVSPAVRGLEWNGQIVIDATNARDASRDPLAGMGDARGGPRRAVRRRIAPNRSRSVSLRLEPPAARKQQGGGGERGEGDARSDDQRDPRR